MAKKTRTRYRTRAKKVYRRARTGGGSQKQVIDGVLAGVGMSLARKFLPNIPFIDDAAVLGIGYFRNNPTLKIIGAMGVGQDIGGMLPIGQGMTTTGCYI